MGRQKTISTILRMRFCQSSHFVFIMASREESAHPDVWEGRAADLGSWLKVQALYPGAAMRTGQSLVGILLWYSALPLMLHGSRGAERPGKEEPAEEPKKLNDLIEQSVN
jgi:hypothetical protein